MAIALGIVILLLGSGLFLYIYIQKRNSSFEGIIIDKDIKEVTDSNRRESNNGITLSLNGDSSNVRHYYQIKIQTPDTKTRWWQVSNGKYEVAKIGDKVIKRPGTTDIEIVPQQPGEPTQPTTQTPPPNNF